MKITYQWIRIGFHVIKLLATIFLAFIIYRALFMRILVNEINLVIYILFWAFSAYLVLPWINRKLTKIYVPHYFIGRTQTSDGLLGDPINIAFNGEKEDILTAFKEAGWHVADPLSFSSSVKIVKSSILGSSYPTAPVSSLFLFQEQQTLAFEREINHNPRRRHHIRLWKTPEGWHLPGGKQADWLGAATYDKNVGLSLFTGQITHKIDSDTDKERDFVIQTLKASSLLGEVEIVEHFTSSYHSRNGGGDRIQTDGALPFVTLQRK
ncbi:LssY C-terminal domain-containing protein [Enterococcus sp. LJL98]